MYAGDYNDISSIKRIADEYNIAILLVHHLRKLGDSSDPFNEISGAGAADTKFILKRKRSDDTATLLVSGRDVEYQELTLQFDNLVWKLLEYKYNKDIHRDELLKFLFRLVDFMNDIKEWTGIATELIGAMNETETSPNIVTKYLGQFSAEVLEPAGIKYKTARTGKARLINLRKYDSNDEYDDNLAI